LRLGRQRRKGKRQYQRAEIFHDTAPSALQFRFPTSTGATRFRGRPAGNRFRLTAMLR
jgi:hypothetical protein